MKALFLMLAGSNTGPVIFIIGLLLISALIGYITSWLYAKSVYTPVIRSLEAEKSDLQKQVAVLKEDVESLNIKLKKGLEKISDLESEIMKRDVEIKKKDNEIEKREVELNKLKKTVQ